MEKPLITIGFDKNGEADFGILSSIQDLSLEKMNQLRQIIPVAIKVAENMWYDEQTDETSLIGQNLASQDLVNKRLKQIDKNADSMNGGMVVSLERSGLTQQQAKKPENQAHSDNPSQPKDYQP